MDSVLINYKRIIQTVFQNYIDFLGRDDETHLEVVIDEERDRYLLIEIGWHHNRRIYSTLFHIDILDGKLWIQQDGSEEGIANELVAFGIEKDQIVLGFKPLERRQVSEFAVS